LVSPKKIKNRDLGKIDVLSDIGKRSLPHLCALAALINETGGFKGVSTYICYSMDGMFRFMRDDEFPLTPFILQKGDCALLGCCSRCYSLNPDLFEFLFWIVNQLPWSDSNPIVTLPSPGNSEQVYKAAPTRSSTPEDTTLCFGFCHLTMDMDASDWTASVCYLEKYEHQSKVERLFEEYELTSGRFSSYYNGKREQTLHLSVKAG